MRSIHNIRLRLLVIYLEVFQISTIPILLEVMETHKIVFRDKPKEISCHSVCQGTQAQVRYQPTKLVTAIRSSIRDAMFSTLTWRPSQQPYTYTVADLPTVNSHTNNSAQMLLTIKRIMHLGAHKPCISHKWCQVHSSSKVQIRIKLKTHHFKLILCKWYSLLLQSQGKFLLQPMACRTRTSLRA